jgi:DNA-binding transcriptional MerR regulator
VSARKPLPKTPPDVLTIKETAKILGVSEVTLRRWDKSGKFSPHRHPLNGYRCYRRSDVLRLRRQIETGEAA